MNTEHNFDFDLGPLRMESNVNESTFKPVETDSPLEIPKASARTDIRGPEAIKLEN